MPPSSTLPPGRPAPRRVEIDAEREEWSFGKLFRLIRADLRFERFDGEMSAPITRINFERGDSVGVLLYDPERDAVVLVRQFRYPAWAGLRRMADDPRRAWLLEIVAGVVDEGLTAEQVAHKELLEEAGYRLRGGLRPLGTILPTPGGSSEAVTLFRADVGRDERVAAGGGVDAEGEDVEVVELTFAEALRRVETGDIVDAKTVVALLRLALEKAGGRVAP